MRLVASALVLLGLHRHYERTCTECGYTWQLTRRQARFKAGPNPSVANAFTIPSLTTPGGSMDDTMFRPTADSAENFAEEDQVATDLKHCPRCGSGTYRQRPVSRHRSAEEPEAPPAGVTPFDDTH